MPCTRTSCKTGSSATRACASSADAICRASKSTSKTWSTKKTKVLSPATITSFSALADRNPFLALHYSVREVREFSNLRNPVLDNLSYISASTLDVSLFAVLRQLSRRGAKIDQLGYIDADFANLSMLASGLVRRHHKRY